MPGFHPFATHARLLACAVFAFLALPSGSLRAAPGDLDPGYILTGASNTTSAMIFVSALQPDGKLVVGGSFTALAGQPRNRLARFNANGTLDANFAPDVDGSVFALAVQADGKIVVAGAFAAIDGTLRNRIARINADGSLDLSFDPNASNSVSAIAIQPDGKIVLGGSFTMLGSATHNRLARLNADGTRDSAFAPNVDNTVNCVAVQSDGKIIAGGSFLNANSTGRARLARFNADGSLDMVFNPAPNASVNCLAVQGDGKILVGGGFAAIAGATRYALARLNASGTIDGGYVPPFHLAIGNAPCSVSDLAPRTDGTLIVIGLLDGDSYYDGTQTRQDVDFVRQLGSTGAFSGTAASGLRSGYTFFNSTIISGDPISTAAVQGDGKVILTGNFVNVNTTPRGGVARFDAVAATQALSATTSTRAEWLRSGSAAEVEAVTFELSTNGGTSWVLLGAGTRIAGGWEKTGLNLPASGLIRARGRINSGGLIEQVNTFPTSLPPTVATGSASGITHQAATLEGTVNPQALATTAQFQYGTTTSYGLTTPVQNLGAGNVAGAVSAPLTGLTPNTTYHFRLVATNSVGTTQGADGVFTTPPTPIPGAPIVVTGAASALAQTVATLNATVNPNNAPTTAIIEYGLTSSYGFSAPVAPPPGNGGLTVAVSTPLSGLTVDTEYHFRVVATNGQGTTNGADATFRTLPVPVLIPQPDRFFVGEQDASLPVLANDGLEDLVILSVTGATIGTVTRDVTNTSLLYTPINTGVPAEDPRDTLTYRVQYSPTGEEAETDVDVYYFLGLRGPYRGTFAVNVGDAVQLGEVDLDLTRTGVASGRFRWEGGTYPFVGQVDLGGRLQVQKPKAGGGGLLVLDMTLDPIARELQGSFSDNAAQPTAVVASVTLEGAPFTPVDRLGKANFTAFIEPPPVVENGTGEQFAPEGAGFSLVNVTKKGEARFAGKLPDAENLSQGFKRPTLADGVASYKFNLPLYKLKGVPRGLLDGEVKVRPQESQRQLDSVLAQNRNAGVGVTFPQGFTILSLLTGDFFPKSGSGLPPGYAERTPNAKVVLRRGGLGAAYEGFLKVTPKRVDLINPPAPAGQPEAAMAGFKMKMVARTGLFSGSFTLPGTTTKVKFAGAIHGNGGPSRGVFTAITENALQTGLNTGVIEITPF